MKKKLTTEEDYRLRVDRVCMYIREHLRTMKIDMRRLAVLSAFSPFPFHRIMLRLSERTDRSVHYTHKGGNGGEAVALY